MNACIQLKRDLKWEKLILQVIKQRFLKCAIHFRVTDKLPEGQYTVAMRKTKMNYSRGKKAITQKIANPCFGFVLLCVCVCVRAQCARYRYILITTMSSFLI